MLSYDCLKKLKEFGIENSQKKEPGYPKVSNAPILKNNINKPKYPENFTHFDYVNPYANKGGEIKLSAFGTFESLNPFLLKSLAPVGMNLPRESKKQAVL